MKRIYLITATVLLLVCATLLTVFFLLRDAEPDPEDFPEVRDLTWAIATPLPEAADFWASIPEHGYTIRFAEDYEFLRAGTYPLELILADEKGNELTRTANFTLVTDTTPPTLDGVKDLLVSLGDGVSYRAGVTVTDNCDGPVMLTVDSSEVNLGLVGIYSVTYTATDAAGNTTTRRISLTVTDYEVTEEALNLLLDEALATIVTPAMTTEEMVRAVYYFVYDHVSYSSTSDKSDWKRAAYDGLTQKEGDCFTYFALCKAFFERLEIENIDLCRSDAEAIRANERHYWSLVNIGTEASPRWYHLDATHLFDRKKPWGLLMTDAQLAEYTAERIATNGADHYFYVFDSTNIPSTPTTQITPY